LASQVGKPYPVTARELHAPYSSTWVGAHRPVDPRDRQRGRVRFPAQVDVGTGSGTVWLVGHGCCTSVVYSMPLRSGSTVAVHVQQCEANDSVSARRSVGGTCG
jgi:hypothetical protein